MKPRPGSHEQDAAKNMIKNKIYYCQLEVKVCETGNCVKLHVWRESMVTCEQLILSHVVNDLRQIKTNYIKFKVYFMAASIVKCIYTKTNPLVGSKRELLLILTVMSLYH